MKLKYLYLFLIVILFAGGIFYYIRISGSGNEINKIQNNTHVLSKNNTSYSKGNLTVILKPGTPFSDVTQMINKLNLHPIYVYKSELSSSEAFITYFVGQSATTRSEAKTNPINTDPISLIDLKVNPARDEEIISELRKEPIVESVSHTTLYQ